MQETNVKYQHNGTECVGFLVEDKNIKGKKPAVLVVHTWRGLDDFVKNKARDLAKLGYIAFAVDIFGNQKQGASDEEASVLIAPFYQDRKLLRERVIAGYETLLNQENVDASNIGAIGFCFGGMTVVELLLSGTPVKSVVCFHGVFRQEGAKIEPIAKNIKGSLLILHGYLDPLSSENDLLRAQKDLSEAKVDWQLNIYGNASHAFTNPVANDLKKGLIYNEKISHRAWLEMINFFKEYLK